MHRVMNGLTLLLILACAAAAAGLQALREDPTLGLGAGVLQAREPGQAGPAEPVTIERPPRIVRAMVDTGLLLERPLFSEGRRPPEPPEQPEPEAPRRINITFNYVLEGLATRRNRRVALLRSRNGQDFVRVSEGEMLGDWRLVRVDPQQAEFELDGRTLVLEIEAPTERGSSSVEWQRVK